jgi:hypothetical protein
MVIKDYAKTPWGIRTLRASEALAADLDAIIAGQGDEPDPPPRHGMGTGALVGGFDTDALRSCVLPVPSYPARRALRLRHLGARNAVSLVARSDSAQKLSDEPRCSSDGGRSAWKRRLVARVPRNGQPRDVAGVAACGL